MWKTIEVGNPNLINISPYPNKSVQCYVAVYLQQKPTHFCVHLSDIHGDKSRIVILNGEVENTDTKLDIIHRWRYQIPNSYPFDSTEPK